MKILLNNFDLNEALKKVKNLGYVPTMGSIHKGHEFLIKQSKRKSKKTLVSIFINPKQFNNKTDYKNYPKNINKDLKILKKLKTDFVYIPKSKDVFNKINQKDIKLEKKDKILCAKYRKGHFEGVLKVMDRLTNLIKPKKIFMGEKDYQQLYLVKKFIEKRYKSKIIACKTIRDKNNLALSSRNILLTNKQKLLASKLTMKVMKLKYFIKKNKNIRSLIKSKKKEFEKNFQIKIEYLDIRNIINFKKTKSIKNSRIFIAYYVGKVRLIDNF
jgi:pantoate--beta-alanine ligase